MEPDFLDAVDCNAQAFMLAGRPDEQLFPVLIQRDTLLELVRSAEVPLLRDAYEQNGLRGCWRAKLDILSTRMKGEDIWPITVAECYAQLGDVRKAVDVISGDHPKDELPSRRCLSQPASAPTMNIVYRR
jgi:hypothetical protein